MNIEFDLTLINKIKGLTIGQYLVLTLAQDVLSTKKSKVTSHNRILSLIPLREKQELIDNNYISITDEGIIKPTDSLLNVTNANSKYFELFDLAFPSYINRPDGTRAYLKGNKKKCKEQYLKIIKGSEDKHIHILSCLNKQLSEFTNSGKLGYMKTMWKWLTTAEWETVEDNNEERSVGYGQSII